MASARENLTPLQCSTRLWTHARPSEFYRANFMAMLYIMDNYLRHSLKAGPWFIHQIQSDIYIPLTRCVPDNHRSYSLGFQFIFQRSLGFLPGPVLFGWIFDSLCLFWGESCGKRGRCQIYDIWNVSLRVTAFGSIAKGEFL